MVHPPELPVQTPPALPKAGSRFAPLCNRVASVILLALTIWLVVADFSFPVDLMFQTSFSGMVLAVVVSLWFMAAIAMAVFPKRIVIGASLLVTSRMAIGWPFNMWLSNSTACLLIDVLLLFVSGMYVFSAFRGGLKIPARPMFQVKHCLVMLGLWLGLGLFSIPITVAGIAKGFENFAGDYVDIGLGGVELKERMFAKDGKTVHLVGMVHIADKQFYAAMDQRLAAPEGRHLVLTEGVTDDEKLLPESFRSGETYAKLAEKLGLTPQRPERPAAAPAAAVAERDAWAEAWKARGVTFMNADIDMAELDKKYLDTLVALLEMMDVDSLLELLIINPADMDAVGIHDAFVEGLLKQRNDRLMEVLAEQLPNADVVHIPWGAAHLPDVEQRLRAEGYEMLEEIERPAIRFFGR